MESTGQFHTGPSRAPTGAPGFPGIPGRARGQRSSPSSRKIPLDIAARANPVDHSAQRLYKAGTRMLALRPVPAVVRSGALAPVRASGSKAVSAAPAHLRASRLEHRSNRSPVTGRCQHNSRRAIAAASLRAPDNLACIPKQARSSVRAMASGAEVSIHIVGVSGAMLLCRAGGPSGMPCGAWARRRARYGAHRAGARVLRPG